MAAKNPAKKAAKSASKAAKKVVKRTVKKRVANTVFHENGPTQEHRTGGLLFSPTGLLPSLVSEFHCSSANNKLCNSCQTMRGLEVMSYDPHQATRARLHLTGLG